MTIQHINSVRYRLEQSIRQRIESGELKSGSVLPTTQELADHFETSVSNAHAALKNLVREGLIVRKHGSGSIVRPEREKLECVAVCARLPEGEFSQLSGFRLKLIDECRAELRRRGIAAEVVLAPDNANLREQLEKLRNSGKIQGAIFTSSDNETVRAFENLAFPYVSQCSYRANFAVDVEFCDWADQLTALLVRTGCRRFGAVFSFPRRYMDNPKQPNDYSLFGACLRLRLECAGIEARENWRFFPDDETLKAGRFEQFGYETIARWAALPPSDRPDTLLVYTDDPAHGVIKSVLRQGIRVPEELRLIFSKNSGLDFLIPFPAPVFILDLSATARLLIDKIMERHDRGTCSNKKIKLQLKEA